MASKRARDKLLRNKPHIRQIEEADLKWLYAAYVRSGGVRKRELFMDLFTSSAEAFDEIYVIEDENPEFTEGRGVIAMLKCRFDGWKFEPFIEFMPWATSRNKLRAGVQSLLFMKYHKGIGVSVMLVHNTRYMDKISEYVKTYRAGQIPGGTPFGTGTVYYIRGKSTHGSVR
jgi:hypothetical protein